MQRLPYATVSRRNLHLVPQLSCDRIHPDDGQNQIAVIEEIYPAASLESVFVPLAAECGVESDGALVILQRKVCFAQALQQNRAMIISFCEAGIGGNRQAEIRPGEVGVSGFNMRQGAVVQRQRMFGLQPDREGIVKTASFNRPSFALANPRLKNAAV